MSHGARHKSIPTSKSLIDHQVGNGTTVCDFRSHGASSDDGDLSDHMLTHAGPSFF